MGLSNFASSTSHQVLTTSFSWIFATSIWFFSGIRATFKRSVMSINHCSASSALSAPVNMAGCNRQKSVMLPALCCFGAVIKPCRRNSVCFCWFSIIFWRTLRISVFSPVGPFRDGLGPLRLPLLFISMLVKDDRKWKVKRYVKFRNHEKDYRERSR